MSMRPNSYNAHFQEGLRHITGPEAFGRLASMPVRPPNSKAHLQEGLRLITKA